MDARRRRSSPAALPLLLLFAIPFLFVPEMFDEIFITHAKTVPDALNSDELDEMLRANREPKDYKGWLGASTEWNTLYSLPRTRTDTVRAVYDGSLFYKLAKKVHLETKHD